MAFTSPEDSVFSLVVLAVYGLGGIFVPMLIIRWAGYQPDTRCHSVTMMIAYAGGRHHLALAWPE